MWRRWLQWNEPYDMQQGNNFVAAGKLRIGRVRQADQKIPGKRESIINES